MPFFRRLQSWWWGDEYPYPKGGGTGGGGSSNVGPGVLRWPMNHLLGVLQ